MPAYWIGRTKIERPGYGDQADLHAELEKKYPHETLARGGAYRVLEGEEDAFNRFVLIKFPSTEAAMAYYNSPEYQLASAARKAASGRTELVITEGLVT